ncbi:PIG-L family deacetylase [Pseudomonas orientalis]|uniref:PIG-L deacetylase family protein n=1 Tax=Pseudomonas orientalis TaxID=76758 RepID=UPI0030DA28EB
MSARVVLLSPHSDDAVWSLGSGIERWAAGRPIVLLTLFDGEQAPGGVAHLPMHERWRRFAAPERRRQEDCNGAASLGFERLSMGFEDAALRRDHAGHFTYGTPQALFLAPQPEHWPTLEARQVARVQAVLTPEDIVFAPLAIGCHVDHCLTHGLARQLDNRVYYYADFPYAHGLGEQALRVHLESLGLNACEETLRCAWPAWRQAALCYRSQVMMLFGSQGRFLEQLADHCQAQGDEAFCRIWSTRSM